LTESTESNDTLAQRLGAVSNKQLLPLIENLVVLAAEDASLEGDGTNSNVLMANLALDIHFATEKLVEENSSFNSNDPAQILKQLLSDTGELSYLIFPERPVLAVSLTWHLIRALEARAGTQNETDLDQNLTDTLLEKNIDLLRQFADASIESRKTVYSVAQESPLRDIKLLRGKLDDVLEPTAEHQPPDSDLKSGEPAAEKKADTEPPKSKVDLPAEEKAPSELLPSVQGDHTENADGNDDTLDEDKTSKAAIERLDQNAHHEDTEKNALEEAASEADRGSPPSGKSATKRQGYGLWDRDVFFRTLASTLIVLLALGFDLLGFETASDNASRNALLKLTANIDPEPIQQPVVVVMIDEAHLKFYKAEDWPLPYEDFAHLLEKIVAAKPAVVMWDLISNSNRNRGVPGVSYRDCGFPEFAKVLVDSAKQMPDRLFLGSLSGQDMASSSLLLECTNDEIKTDSKKQKTIILEEIPGIKQARIAWIAQSHLYPLQVKDKNGGDELFDTAAFAAVKTWRDVNHKMPLEFNDSDDGTPPEMVLRWPAYKANMLEFQRTGSCAEASENYSVGDIIWAGLFGGKANTYDDNPDFVMPQSCWPLQYIYANELIVAGSRNRAALLENKIVFIGVNISGINDTIVSPVHGRIPGVFLHATAAHNLIMHETTYFRDAPPFFGFGKISTQDVTEFMFVFLVFYVFASLLKKKYSIGTMTVWLCGLFLIGGLSLYLGAALWYVFPTNWLTLISVLFLSFLSVVIETFYLRLSKKDAPKDTL